MGVRCVLEVACNEQTKFNYDQKTDWHSISSEILCNFLIGTRLNREWKCQYANMVFECSRHMTAANVAACVTRLPIN